MVYKANMSMTKQPTESYTSFEHMEVLMRTSNDCVRLCVMYHPPSNSVADFMEDFLDFIDHHTTTSGRLLVVGDLNLHLDNEKDRNASAFRDLMHSLNLYQHVHEPTHDRGLILDVVVTSTDDSSLIEGLSVLPFARSDHHILSFTLPWSHPTSVKTKHNFRKIKDINIEAFKESVKTSNLVQSPPTELNDLVQEYDRTQADILEQHAPLLIKEVVLRPYAPWYNSSIREAKQARRKAERRYRKDKTTINKDMFKDSQREVNRLCTEAKTEHLSRKVSENEKDPKALFNIAKQMLAKGKDNTLPSHGSEKDLANKSATFFDTNIATIRKTFHGSITNQCEQPLSNNTPESFENFENISESNLEKLISSGNSKTSSLDPIPTSLLKKVLPVLLPTIHTIVNKSLQSGQMPHHLKRAIVKPIIKKSTLDPENMKHYRPVSNLAYIGKIIEKVVVAQLDAHLTDNDLHEPLQSAYRTGHSTETALLKVSNDILLALDKRQCVYLVLLDLSAAFDTIDHTVFLSRVEKENGVTADALGWMSSYLSGRQQCVSINSTLSDNIDLLFGFIQGS